MEQNIEKKAKIKGKTLVSKVEQAQPLKDELNQKKYRFDEPKVEAIKENPAVNLLELDRNNILQGVIFAEILGKPKSRRRGVR